MLNIFCVLFVSFSFPNLGIQHVTKKNVKSVLKDRYLKKHRLESSFSSGQPMNIDLGNQAGPSSEEALTRAITGKKYYKFFRIWVMEISLKSSTVRTRRFILLLL